MGFTVKGFYLLFCLLLAFNPASVAAIENATGPLQVRNMGPVVQLYGIPRMAGAHIVEGDKQISFNFEAANNFQSDLAQGTFGFFDGETYVSSWGMRDDFAEVWEWSVEIPWVVHVPGSLDGLVDEFHELFGLPDGDRSLASRGRLDYFIGSDGVVYTDFNNSRREIGDVRTSIGRQMFDDERGVFALRSSIKFPTGNVADLSGSEGLDVALWGEYEYTFNLAKRNVRLSVGGGLSYLGEGELIPHAQETWAHFGHLGFQIPIHPRVEFHAQLDAHSAILKTGNPLIADGGILGTIGGRIGVTPRLWLDLAIIEDLDAESASDVVFQILLGARI